MEVCSGVKMLGSQYGKVLPYSNAKYMKIHIVTLIRIYNVDVSNTYIYGFQKGDEIRLWILWNQHHLHL